MNVEWIDAGCRVTLLDRNLVSVIINCMHINQKSAVVVRNCLLFLNSISSDGNLERGMDWYDA